MKYIISGIVFAALFFFSLIFQLGWSQALAIATISGFLFALSIFAFVNNPIVKRQTAFPADKLLPEEVVKETYGANLIIRLDDFELEAFAAGGLMWAVGMKGKESIGGKLHLTNYRLYFQSHRLNRLRGAISIFLPQIDHVQPQIKYIVFRQASVAVGKNTMRFVVSDPVKFAQIVEMAAQESKIIEMDIANHATTTPEKCVAGLEKAQLVVSVNNLLNRASAASDISKLVADPIGAIGSMLLADFQDRMGKSAWNDHLDRSLTSSATDR